MYLYVYNNKKYEYCDYEEYIIENVIFIYYYIVNSF